MVQGELTHQRFGTHRHQITRTQAPVVQISGEPPSHGKTELGEKTRHRAADDAQPRMAFADVVEQRGPDQLPPDRNLGRHPARRLQRMPLIGHRLRPE